MTYSVPPRPVIFGEILFDHFPDGNRVLGGAPLNVAWHLEAFGMKPLMISRIGTDPEGQEILDAMQYWGMDASAIQIDELHPTGKVKVTIVGDEPEYEISRHSAYDFIDEKLLPVLPDKHLLYHGTLSLRETKSRAGLKILKDSPLLDCFLDINLRAPFWSRETLADSLYSVKMLKLNQVELCLLAEMFSLSEAHSGLNNTMQAVFDHFRLEQLVMTQGADGVCAIDSARTMPLQLEMNQATEVVDTVGAGDAFSSVLLLGRCLQWPLELTLSRAQSFASHIVTVRGATVSNRDFYKLFKLEWKLNQD